MATNDAELVIKLRADLEDANKKISNFTKNAENQVSGLEKSFSALKIVAGAAVAAFAGGKILSGIKSSIDAAKIQEDAVNSLNTSLKLAGDFSETASQDIQKFASQLQSVSTIGDETTLKLFGLAKNFGLSNEKTKELTKAAIELSAATGISLESAITNLGKSTGGLVGELGESIPSLKNLSIEALKSGAAIDFVLERFGGAAASKVDTFSGATTQLANTFGDLQEEIGFTITQNPVFIEAIKLASEALNKVGEFVKNNRSEIIEFINKGLKAVIKAVPFVTSALRVLLVPFELIAKTANFLQNQIAKLIRQLLDFQIVKSTLDFIGEAFRNLTSLILNGIQKMLGAFASIPGVGSLFDSLGLDIKNVQFLIQETADELAKKPDVGFSESVTEAYDKIIEATDPATGAVTSFFDTLNDGVENVQGFADKVVVEIDKIAERAKKGVTVNLETGSTGATSGLKKEEKKKTDIVTNAFGKEIEKSTIDGINKGAQIFSGIISGDAKGTVAGLGGLAADAFLPGTGQAVNQILGLLSGGPDQVKAQIEAFVEQLPIIIEAIVEAIPVVAETIADNSDVIILRLAEAMPRVAVALGTALVRVIEILLTNALREIGNVFRQVTISGLTEGIQGAFEGIEKVFTDFATSLNKIGDVFEIAGNAFNTFFENLQKFADSISGRNLGNKLTPGKNTVVGRIASGIGSAFGFANGITEIPSGFQNDSFPAGLTSGERVVDADTNSDLKAFLRAANQQGQGNGNQTMIVTLQIGQEELARQILKLDKSNFQLRA